MPSRLDELPQLPTSLSTESLVLHATGVMARLVHVNLLAVEARLREKSSAVGTRVIGLLGTSGIVSALSAPWASEVRTVPILPVSFLYYCPSSIVLQ